MSVSSAATLNLGRCMTSEVFELVANDDVQFFVNRDILASQSKPFKEATLGPWKEAAERKIDLKDWDSDTVARLVEFLYIRNYSYPDPTPLKPDPEPTGGDPGPAKTEEGEEDDASVPDRDRPLTPLEDCLRQSLPPDEEDPITDSERLERCDPTDYDFEEILLAHAKVYALANYKSVDMLRTLALKRLLLTLSRLHPIQPTSHISMNVVDLASYVYANTDYLSRSEEPLRKLTSHFIALNFAAFQTEPRAVELVAQGGDFVKDLMAKICRRLPDPEGVFWAGGRSRKGYISGIKVMYGSYTNPPADRMTEVNGLDSNISHTYVDPYTIWLVPEYTKIAKDACTKFLVSTTSAGHIAQNNLDRTHGSYCYLDAVRDTTVLAKITVLALYRSTPGVSLNVKTIGYDGMSGDIRNKSTNNPLYLVWKSVKTRRL